MTSALEYTNEPYAIAKIAGMKMCESFNLQYGTDYISVMPTNLYGPRDNFHLQNSHVLPAMIRKMHLAKLLRKRDENALRTDLNRRPLDDIDGKSTIKEITDKLSEHGISSESLTLWGSGAPMREFLWSEDMADASVHILLNVSFDSLKGDKTETRNCHINIGTGKEISIAQLSAKIQDIVKYDGEIRWDTSKPDGTMRKLCDVSKLHSLGWRHKVEIDNGIQRLYDWYLANQ